MEQHPHLVTHLPITNFHDSSRGVADDLHFGVAIINRGPSQNTGYEIGEHSVGQTRYHEVGVTEPNKTALLLRNNGQQRRTLILEVRGNQRPISVDLNPGDRRQLNVSDLSGREVEFMEARSGKVFLGNLKIVSGNGQKTFEIEKGEEWLEAVQRRAFVPEHFQGWNERFTVAGINIGSRRTVGLEGTTRVTATRDRNSQAVEHHADTFRLLVGNDPYTHLRLAHDSNLRVDLKVEWFTQESDTQTAGEDGFTVKQHEPFDLEIPTGHAKVVLMNRNKHATATIVFTNRRRVEYRIR